jgi:ATP-dependent exoDNAse (exonuclease V) beta subunit
MSSPGGWPRGERTHAAWRATRDEAVTRGRVPSVRVDTVTGWVRRQDRHADPGSPAGAPRVDVVAIDGEARRPGGQRFGALVHAALAVVPLDADARAVETVVATQARILGAPDEERTTATTVVCATLRHPILEAARDAARSGRCHRELPMTNLIDGTLVEGVADLVYEQGDGLVVVDFKTDRPDGMARDRYQRQVALYAGALALATGRPVHAVLLTI